MLLGLPEQTWLSYPGFQAAQGLLALSMRLSTRGRDEQPHMASWPLSRLRGMLLGLPEHAGADHPGFQAAQGLLALVGAGDNAVAGMSSLTCAAGHAEGSEACYSASQSTLAQISRLPGCAGSAGGEHAPEHVWPG